MCPQFHCLDNITNVQKILIYNILLVICYHNRSKRSRHLTELSHSIHYKIPVRRVQFLSPFCRRGSWRARGVKHLSPGPPASKGQSQDAKPAVWLSGWTRSHILMWTQKRGFLSEPTVRSSPNFNFHFVFGLWHASDCSQGRLLSPKQKLAPPPTSSQLL